MTRIDKIAAHFRTVGPISQMEATGLYRMPQLPAVIHTMKARGWGIKTEMKTDVTGKPYARYFLISDPADAQNMSAIHQLGKIARRISDVNKQASLG